MELKLLSCPLCQKPNFHGVDSLRSTLISAATSQLKCPVCEELLLGLDKLTIHLFSHINEVNNEAAHIEKDIPETSEDRVKDEDLSQCISSLEGKTNNNNDVISCDICHFTFDDPTILEMHHKLLHQTTPDKNTGLYSYHCHLCSKKFKKRGTLMVHLRVVHFGFSSRDKEGTGEESCGNKRAPDNKQWECDICSKMFTTKYFLKKHKRLHTGEMPYFCAPCNKSFTFQQSYHKHMLYHSSDKPHLCNECGRAFKELSTLQNHQRIHSGERPFGCETCGKRFRQRVSYLVHQRIHTGIMPYKCTACDKCFRYKVSQRSHKCPKNPPGNVVRVVDTEKSTNQNNVKCIMSVDLNTGNIKLIESENTHENFNEDCKINTSTVDQNESPDLYSMIMSPNILPEVESLCLTNSPPMDLSNVLKINCEENLTINQDTLSELLYSK